jgi:hypothetical protein
MILQYEGVSPYGRGGLAKGKCPKKEGERTEGVLTGKKI